MGRCLSSASCGTCAQSALDDADRHGWELAYALAWLSVAGGNSVIPPWVRHQFPGADRLVRRLRDTACDDSACEWCRERHDARRKLARWFGFDGFRSEPADEDRRPLQRSVVEASMAGEQNKPRVILPADPWRWCLGLSEATAARRTPRLRRGPSGYASAGAGELAPCEWVVLRPVATGWAGGPETGQRFHCEEFPGAEVRTSLPSPTVPPVWNSTASPDPVQSGIHAAPSSLWR